MSERKTVSVMIPCYNEEENVRPIYEAVREQLLPSRMTMRSCSLTTRARIAHAKLSAKSARRTSMSKPSST